MSCAVGTLSTRCAGGILLTGCGCGKWACGDCARYKVRRIVAAILDGEPTKFLTFTWDASRPESRERARQIMGEDWKLLVAKIRRRYPASEFHYVVTVERTKRGYPHFHVLARSGWIDQKWLSKTVAALWGAPVCEIEEIRSKFGMAFYVAKYLTKALERIGTGKRYWFSQGFAPEAPAEVAGAPPRQVWYRDPETPLMLLARFARAGYRRVSGTDARMVIGRDVPP